MPDVSTPYRLVAALRRSGSWTLAVFVALLCVCVCVALVPGRPEIVLGGDGAPVGSIRGALGAGAQASPAQEEAADAEAPGETEDDTDPEREEVATPTGPPHDWSVLAFASSVDALHAQDEPASQEGAVLERPPRTT